MKKIVIVLVSLIGLSAQASQQWSYEYESQWPGECTTGQQQSPINIMSREAHVDEHQAHIRGPLAFRGYGDVQVTAENNGHTLKWSNVPGTPAPVLSGGPLRGNYTFLQFHLHWISEHAIDGIKYPLEIHLVHVKTGLQLAEAVERPDGLAVIGVLCVVSSESGSNFALEEIIGSVPALVEKNTLYEPKNIDVRRLISPVPQSYYTYHGSLTTPLCQEVVTWIVMDNPLHISDTQYKEFRKVNVGGIDNYRSLQPVNRMVYRPAFSCSSMMVPSFFGLVTCLSSTLTSKVFKGICLLDNMKKQFIGREISQC